MPDLPADNPFTEEGIYLGRMLFYDPILSIDSSISCASCHQQKFAFADPAAKSTGVFGLKTGRNSSALFNLAYSQRFFWDARQKTIRDQLFEPIQAHSEMGMTLPLLRDRLLRSERYKAWFKKSFNEAPDLILMAKAMEQFLLSIVSKDSKFDKAWPQNFSVYTPEEREGFFIYNGRVDFDNGPNRGADCFHCHGGILAQNNHLTQGGLTNNGLDAVLTDLGLGAITGKSSDNGKFKTPSLRNMEFTGPFMHDGRFATIEETIDHYSDDLHFDSPNIDPSIVHMKDNVPTHMNLTAIQKAQLVAFLKTMSDTVLLSNSRYSDPFK
jgi:cytochrome c peroxidase